MEGEGSKPRVGGGKETGELLSGVRSRGDSLALEGRGFSLPLKDLVRFAGAVAKLKASQKEKGKKKTGQIGARNGKAQCSRFQKKQGGGQLVGSGEGLFGLNAG